MIPIAVMAGVAVVKALAPLIIDLVDKHDKGQISDEEFINQWVQMTRQLRAANAAFDAAPDPKKEN